MMCWEQENEELEGTEEDSNVRLRQQSLAYIMLIMMMKLNIESSLSSLIKFNSFKLYVLQNICSHLFRTRLSNKYY